MNRLLGVETLHPLIAVVDFSKIISPVEDILFTCEFYSVMLKDGYCGELKYGRNKYDYQEQTMVFFAPNQVIGVEGGSDETESKGLGLFFHPDLLRSTSLFSEMKNYNFFSYEVSEALHLSQDERKTIGDCFGKILSEISRPIDKHSRHIIVSNIELLLGYCQRFYDRQFITREIVNQDTIARFETVLNDYYQSGAYVESGLPTVKYIAEKLSLSANYMSDLIKRETGRSAQEHIQILIIERAKSELSTTSKSISEIAYSLGFDYAQYFSRQFKKRTGMTPNEYRALS